MERRLLAAEGVGLLCPHVSRDMRASFLLSICQQLVSDNETAVVVMAVHSLAVILNTLEDDVKLMKAMDQLDQALDKHSFQTDIISALATSLLPVLAVKSASALTEKNVFEKVLGKLLENLHFVTQIQERIKLVVELLPLAAYTLVGHNPGHSQVFFLLCRINSTSVTHTHTLILCLLLSIFLARSLSQSLCLTALCLSASLSFCLSVSVCLST